jgi:N-acetylglucosamine malate deacetylase 1
MNPYKLDLLALAAHPDDAELGCGGTLLAHIALGKKTGILDLTRGELGTRGSAEIRRQEADSATGILGLSLRENLELADGFFQNTPENQLRLVLYLRHYQPEIVLANAITDRHPDHGKGSQLASDACFLAGLAKIETFWGGIPQLPWRPKAVYHYLQDRYIQPDLVVDITPFWEQKMQAIRAYASQFYNPDSSEPATTLSTPEYVLFLEARARDLGRAIGVTFGEGFTRERYVGIKNLFDLI